VSTTTEHTGNGTVERLRFFPRQLISADDLNEEQAYHRAKLREHNRFLHGWGVVCGCDVRAAPEADKPWRVRICPGYLLTPQGESVWIRKEALLDLATCFLQSKDPCAFAQPCPPITRRTLKNNLVYLAVRYSECTTRPVRVAPTGCSCDETECEYSRVVDSYEFCCLHELPGTHTTLEDECEKLFEVGNLIPCPDCPDDPWVVIATITLPESSSVEIADTDIDPLGDRRVLYSTATLQQMAACLGRGLAGSWHSVEGDVYHNNRNCTTGNNIETENYRSGTGGQPLCKECARLNAR
jgi:hypothetical protein